MDIDVINGRVDKALADNGRAERIVTSMAVAIFLLGVAVVTVGFWHQNPYMGTGALVFQGTLYWPIREILKLREDNLFLQTVPAVISFLPPEQAAIEISKTLEYLRNGRGRK